MIHRVYIMALVGLGAAALWFIASGNIKAARLEAEIEAARSRADNYAVQSEKLKQALDMNMAALADREKTTLRLAMETDRLKDELGTLYEINSTCAAWADNNIPDDVFRRLRQD